MAAARSFCWFGCGPECFRYCSFFVERQPSCLGRWRNMREKVSAYSRFSTPRHDGKDWFPQFVGFPDDDSLTRTLGKNWLRRRAYRVEPAANVYLGMSFTAVMSCTRCIGGFRIPPVNGEIGISASNHEPVDRIGGNQSTNFAPEFLQHCHAFSPVCR